MTVEQLRDFFNTLRAEGADGEGEPAFGAAGAAQLLQEAGAARALVAEAAADPTPVATVTSAQLLRALDSDGDGRVSWEDFEGVIGAAADKVDSRIYTVSGSLLFNFTAQGAALPTIPLIAREIGCTTADIGFITSAAAGSRLLCNIPCAWLAEKVGRRPPLIAGPAIGAVAISMFGVSATLPQLIGWNALFGVGNSLTATSSTLYLNDVATPRNRSRTTAPTTVTALLGFALGPAFAGIIGDAYGLSNAFFLCAAGMAAASASAIIFLPETQLPASLRASAAVAAPAVAGADAPSAPEDAAAAAAKEAAVWRQWRRLLAVPNLQALYVSAFSTGMTHGSFPVSIVFMNETLGMSPSHVGGYFATCVISMAITTPLFSKLADRAASRKHVMAPGMAAAALAAAAQPFCTTASQFIAVGVCGAVSNAAVMPNLAAFIMDNSPEEERAQALALRLVANDLGMVVGASTMGLLAFQTDVPTAVRPLPSPGLPLAALPPVVAPCLTQVCACADEVRRGDERLLRAVLHAAGRRRHSGGALERVLAGGGVGRQRAVHLWLEVLLL